jgi:pSer/pThr/pTyr-binding forkhead associated (FHA) protein
MLVILHAVSGPVTGRRIEIRSGSILRIGRTARADHVIAEDSYLSSQHFALECDRAQCRIRDLGSSNGTFLNGDRVEDAWIRNGDSIAAGSSTFSVQLDLVGREPDSGVLTSTPTLQFPVSRLPFERTVSVPIDEDISAWPGFSKAQSVLLDTLYRPGDPVFALLDPVRDPRIPAFLDAAREEYARVDDTVASSPYLVSLPRRTRLLDVLVKDGWGHQWGFYFSSRDSFEQNRLHWRSYVVLRTERSKEITFPFWDPRVLRIILPAMPAEEARDFLGPASRLTVEGEKPEIALEFSLGPRSCRQNTVVLA